MLYGMRVIAYRWPLFKPHEHALVNDPKQRLVG
jgi:hypothetical protein